MSFQVVSNSMVGERLRSDARQDAAVGVSLQQLEAVSLRGLRRMFSPQQNLFVFRVRRHDGGVLQEGLSLRYTAITMLGLARMHRDVRAGVTAGAFDHVLTRLLRDASGTGNLGDAALSLWAGEAAGASAADLEPVLNRLAELRPTGQAHPTVELAWTLSALSDMRTLPAPDLRDDVAARLLAAFNPTSKIFPHLDGAASMRSHVTCFADIIYPIQALAKYAAATRNQRALDVASACAAHLCSKQGEAGQWWWHYDYRTGEVLERYPVYAIHQDAMGPMGLRALRDAGGLDCSAFTRRGVQWLMSAPELGGGSLIDRDADLIWRKVARREPRKLVRLLQSALSRVHPSLRMPAVDTLFPPGTVDYEDRPYHLGWFLYAWAGLGLSGEL